MELKQGGVATSIVNILSHYDDPVPLRYLARRVGVSTEDLAEYVKSLEDEGVLELKDELVILKSRLNGRRKISVRVTAN